MVKDILAGVGGIFLVAVVGCAVIIAIDWLKMLFEKLKYKYRVKHRFDKPPMAKCYCVDCERHNNKSDRCYKFDGWYTADNWFCWDAKPREKEPKEN